MQGKELATDDMDSDVVSLNASKRQRLLVRLHGVMMINDFKSAEDGVTVLKPLLPMMSACTARSRDAAQARTRAKTAGVTTVAPLSEPVNSQAAGGATSRRAPTPS